MSQIKFDLSPIAATISDAASAQAHATNQWKKAGSAAAKAGVTSDMLIKPTEKKPNDIYNESAYTQIVGFIVQGVSARIKTLTLPSGKYTVAEMLALSRDSLRDIDDPVMKSMRRDYMQEITGTYMSRIRNYIDRANGIVKDKGSKGDADTETSAESTDPIVVIQGIVNKATQIVDVVDVDRFQNAGLEMIALLRKHRK
jgi:hypothetical protein